jgi:hypothetical protein
MPVSKKRKKEGKPVRRAGPAPAAEAKRGGEAKPDAPQLRVGKPSNPFVAQQQAKRGALRGR